MMMIKIMATTTTSKSKTVRISTETLKVQSSET